MQAHDYRAVYNRVVPVVEKTYGVEVVISDVVDPNTGDFDGERILLDYDQDLEVALFVLVHLFGHTAQWCTSDAYRKLGLDAATSLDAAHSHASEIEARLRVEAPEIADVVVHTEP